jgi:hypothetical protein
MQNASGFPYSRILHPYKRIVATVARGHNVLNSVWFQVPSGDPELIEILANTVPETVFLYLWPYVACS